MIGICCVTHPESIRGKSVLDDKVGIYQIHNPISAMTIRKNIDNIIQDKNIGDMISLIPTLKTNNKYILNTFINMDNVKADLFIKCTSIKPIEKNINEARKTIKRILDEQSLAKEDLKFNKILEKWRKKEHLSEEEKSILKAGNKSKKV